MGIVFNLNEANSSLEDRIRRSSYSIYATGEKGSIGSILFMLKSVESIKEKSTLEKIDIIASDKELPIEVFGYLDITKQDLIKWAKSKENIDELLVPGDNKEFRQFVEDNKVVSLFTNGFGDYLVFCPTDGNIYEYEHERFDCIDKSKYISVDKFLKLCKDLWKKTKQERL